MKNKNLNKSLKDIEKAIKNGQDPNHFESLLNKLLGTETSDSDEELDQVWEDNYRGNG